MQEDREMTVAEFVGIVRALDQFNGVAFSDELMADLSDEVKAKPIMDMPMHIQACMVHASCLAALAAFRVPSIAGSALLLDLMEQMISHAVADNPEAAPRIPPALAELRAQLHEILLCEAKQAIRDLGISGIFEDGMKRSDH